MYFKIALFWLYSCKGAHVSDYLGFPKVGEKAVKKESFLERSCSLEKLVFQRIPVKRQERRKGSRASAT